MVNGIEQMKRFATAARALMEEGHVNVDGDIFSKTLFMSVTRRGSVVEAAALVSAAKQGWGKISLEFGRTGRAKGPLSYTVSFLDDDGSSHVVHDCRLVRDPGASFVLVPLSTTYHFAIGPKGLERRHGRPSNMRAGEIRAARALAEAARNADSGEPFLEVRRFGEVG